MSSITEGGITVEVKRKKIKNMYLRVYTEEKRVVLSCPYHLNSEHIQNFVRDRVSWIRKHLKKDIPERIREDITYITGDQLQIWGKPVKLKVYETASPPQVVHGCDSAILMFVKKNSTSIKRKTIIEKWCRGQLREAIGLYISKWEPILNVKVFEFGIKKMKTRWGTCNIRDKRIWLNLDLVKYNVMCLESVVVHEMVHLFERHHSARFYRLMDEYLPDWRERERPLRMGGIPSPD